MILQHEKADDFVIGSGEQHTVREFVTQAFNSIGKQITWEGVGLEEKAYLEGKVVVEVEPTYFRPRETNPVLADYTKAKRVLGWKPETTFEQLVKYMVNADISRHSSKCL